MNKLKCIGRGSIKKKKCFENLKKNEFHSALFSPPGWRTGSNFLFKGGLSEAGIDRFRFVAQLSEVDLLASMPLRLQTLERSGRVSPTYWYAIEWLCLRLE